MHRLILFVIVGLLKNTKSLRSSNYGRPHTRRAQLFEEVGDGDKLGARRLFDLIEEVGRDEKARNTIASITAISAPLGVLLDNQHGLFGVLEYNSFQCNLVNPFMKEELILRSATWVPFLFAFAGWVMSYIQLVADEFWYVPVRDIKPWRVLYGISAFSALYWLSGWLDYRQVDPNMINLILSSLAVAGFCYFDFTKAGLFLSLVTAISGPLVEIGLSGIGLYQYSHADVFKIASWIPAVYFLGGSAVGNLTRYLYRR